MHHHLHLFIHPLIYPSVVLWDFHGICVDQTEWQPLANATSLCLRSTWSVQRLNWSNWTFRDTFILRLLVPFPVSNTLTSLKWVLCGTVMLGLQNKMKRSVWLLESVPFSFSKGLLSRCFQLSVITHDFHQAASGYQTFMEHWLLI